MFASFDKVFQKSGFETRAIPKTFVDYLNTQVPDDFFYQVDEKENICVLSGKNGELHFSGMHLVLSEAQSGIIGENCKMEDVLFFSYNSQQPIQIEPDKKNTLIINGEQIELGRLLVAPYKPWISVKDDGLWLIPPPFPKAREIELGGEDYAIDISVQRVANESVDIEKYVSTDEASVLQLVLLVNRITHECSLNLSIRFALAQNIEDIVKISCIYNSFVEGNGKINGEKWVLTSDSIVDEVKKVDNVFLSFWMKALEIEKVLNITFRIPKGSIDYKTARDLEFLYQGLVKHVPVKSERHFTEISFNDVDDIEEKTRAIDKPVLLAYYRVVSIELFQEKIVLPAFTCVFNKRIEKVEKKGGSIVVTLEDEDSNKKGFSSTLVFVNDDAKKSFFEEGIDARIDSFRMAKTVDECLQTHN